MDAVAGMRRESPSRARRPILKGGLGRPTSLWRRRAPENTCTYGALTPDGFHEETLTGSYVDISNPDPADIRLEDVASGLANTCRGAGQLPFFSVAEHAVLVARRLRDQGYPPQVVSSGLHHDDPEAYLHDLTKPLKVLLARSASCPRWVRLFWTPGPSYAELEAQMWEAIRIALGLGYCDITHPAIKEADTWALAAESYHLRRSRGSTWYCHGAYCPKTTPLQLGLSPAQAEALWLAENHRVRAEID